MDFFERQEKARHNTKLLVVYFVVGVTLLVLAVYLAALVILGATGSKQHAYDESVRYVLWNPKLFLAVLVGTLAVIIIGSLFKTAELARGGSAVADMLGGRLINSNAIDLDERKLLNVVEEMALASGVPVPQVYVMDEEHGINAFAAGHSTSDAVVAVTRGCMTLLTRDELQGVIGHEFSHIVNGDMRLNLRLMGIIFGILCLAIVGRVLLHTRGRKNPLPLLGLALLVIGWVGVLFGRMIQAAVSRQREFLADASSVQFTRNPTGLAGALKKIGGLAYGSKLESPHAAEASHMFFGNGIAEPLFGLLATHPPLTERIRAIETSFDGKFPDNLVAQVGEQEPPPLTARQRPPIPFPFPFPGAIQSRTSMAGLVPAIIAAQAVMPNLGAPTSTQLRQAVMLRGSYPPAVQEAARDPLGAATLIYGLLISSQPEIRKRQLQLLAESTSDAVRHETEILLPAISEVTVHAKLPLVDLALPALRHFSPAQYSQFSAALQRLIECDNEIELFEYVLQKIVLRHLDPQFNGARKPVLQYYALRPLARDCSALLSAVARVGANDPAQAQAAFQRAALQLSAQAQSELMFVPEDQCDLPQVDDALNRLSKAVPQIKKNVLNACAQAVAADGLIQETEAELLRAVADTLDCPIPPFVQPKNEAPTAAPS